MRQFRQLNKETGQLSILPHMGKLEVQKNLTIAKHSANLLELNKKAKKLITADGRYRWWRNMEDRRLMEGEFWKTLVHMRMLLPVDYQRLPPTVKLYYDGKAVELTDITEEIRTLIAKCKYVEGSDKTFCQNFFQSWSKEMSVEERAMIQDFNKCNFMEMKLFFEALPPTKMSQQDKERASQELEEYGYCTVKGIPGTSSIAAEAYRE